MFNKSDDADCVAKKMKLPTLNDWGDRSLFNYPFVYSCRVQANYLVYGNFLDITPLQLDIQKVSGYFPIPSVRLPHTG
jgi:hypothetical protein